VKQSYATTRDGSAAIVTAEIEDGQVYERLLGSARRPHILAVFQSLQGSSQQRPLSVPYRRLEHRPRKEQL
jgi:hypothetical protein